MAHKSIARIFVISIILILFAHLYFIQLPSQVAKSPSPDLRFPSDLEISKEETWKNKTIIIEKNLTVSSSGHLSIIDTILIFNNTNSSLNYFRVMSDGKLTMKNSSLQHCGVDDLNPGLQIFSDKVEIINCTFIDNFAGISLSNISNISITQCKFNNNNYGVLFKNCDNIKLLECEFENNSKNSLSLENSGNMGIIDLVNCTIIQIKQSNSGITVELINSSMRMLNVSSSNTIKEIVHLDNASELIIAWYVHFQIVYKKETGLSFVEISIQNFFDDYVGNYTTDDNGYLTWIILPQKKLVGNNEDIPYNPYTIRATKKGYSKMKEIFTINSTESEPIVYTLKKSEDADEDEFTRTLYMMCVCGIVVFLVFIIFMAINVRIVKKRLDASGYKTLDSVSGKTGGLATGGEIITCSECGAQVSSDVKFCPHCGEYFEGEEFTCPGCGAVVKEDDKACSKCGRIFEEGKEKPKGTSKTVVGEKAREDSKKLEKRYCSECGAVVSDQEERCPGCGLLFEGTVDKKTSKTAGKAKKKEKMQPKDLFKLEEGMKPQPRKITEGEETKLKHVGRQKKDTKSEDLYMCSVCGEELTENAKRCPKCGIEFE